MPRQAIELQEVDSFGAWDLQHFAHDLGTSSAFLAQENSYIHIVFLNGLVKGCERENGRMLFHSVSHVFPIQIASSSLLHPNTHPNIPQPPNIPSSHHLPTASYSVCHSPLKPHIEAKRSSSGRFSRWSPSASRVWKRKPMASRRSWLSWGWVAT